MNISIADGLIKLETIIIYKYTSSHGSIYYIVALKVHMWCTKVFVGLWLASWICDWIWENPASMNNYKYLEIPV